MKVVRRGGAAGGAVVEDGVVWVFGREVQHVRQMVPDGLREMLVAGDDEVVLEDGVRVDLDMVAAALAPLEEEVALACRAVLRAEEARPRGDGLGGGVGRRGGHALGVPLDPAGEPEDGQLLGPGAFERPEIGGSERPDGKLVFDELA